MTRTAPPADSFVYSVRSVRSVRENPPPSSTRA